METTSCLTHGVEISVKQQYESLRSDPQELRFIYSYTISIENHNKFPVQLLYRHWFLTDSLGRKRRISGEGVVGTQPLIDSGAIHRYNSNCQFTTLVGKMFGFYEMINIYTKEKIRVDIPEFVLIAPWKNN